MKFFITLLMTLLVLAENGCKKEEQDPCPVWITPNHVTYKSGDTINLAVFFPPETTPPVAGRETPAGISTDSVFAFIYRIDSNLYSGASGRVGILIHDRMGVTPIVLQNKGATIDTFDIGIDLWGSYVVTFECGHDLSVYVKP